QNEDPVEEFIELADRIGTDVKVGKLVVSGRAPRLDLGSRTSLDLTWPDTVVRFDCHDELRTWVGKWRWHDFADSEQGVGSAQVIAMEHNRKVSLIRSAASPYPVDHLIEQFGIDANA